MTGIATLCVGIGLAYLYLAWKKPVVAFSMLPIVITFLVYVAAQTDSPEIDVVAVFLFLLTLMVVAATGWERQSRQWFHWGAWYLLVGIVGTLVMGVLLAGIHSLGTGYPLVVIFIASGLVIFASLINYGVTSRHTRAVNVFSFLAASMRQNLPLPMALDCAATGDSSETGVILRGIKMWLVKGCSLADAVRRGYAQCPSGALAMIAAGEGIGQLPAALRAIEADVKCQTVGPRRLRPIHPFYPVLVIAFILFLMVGVMTFVLPRLDTALAEVVEGRLPFATRVLCSIMHGLTDGPYGILILILAAVMVLSHSLYRSARRHRDRKGFLLWHGDLLLWSLPFVRGFERRLAMVQVLELLRISLTAGCPVNEAIRGTLKLDVNLFLQKRLRRWLDRVERGENIAESARQCGLGPALAWAFDSGADTANTPAILELLESHYRSSYVYRVNVTRYILWPAAIVLVGLMVGFVVYAIFSPTVAIINMMALNVYP
ncbi:MAG: type II secretion system F family protein [Phycisphaerales bacterium]